MATQHDKQTTAGLKAAMLAHAVAISETLAPYIDENTVEGFRRAYRKNVEINDLMNLVEDIERTERNMEDGRRDR